ncbi:MAG: flagellar hook capping protein [Planctomycetes bacterium]|nr:flagellar hook capping protein [Planctomycetota bacterium]
MAVSPVTSALTNLGTNLNTAVSQSNNQLGKDAFLKLLATQMRYQNPLDPINNADFIAQLSQFSTTEGVQQLNTNFSQMLLLQQMTQSANLIGKTILFDKPGSNFIGQGVVTAVKVDNGALNLVVGQNFVALSQVRGIKSQ